MAKRKRRSARSTYSKPPLRRITYTKKALSKRLAGFLTDTANIADVYRQGGDKDGAQMKENQLDGMIMAARDIGIECSCPFIAGHKIFLCSCNGERPLSGTQRKRK